MDKSLVKQWGGTRLAAWGLGLLALTVGLAAQPSQPVSPEILPLSQIKPGETGEVWTVFQGTKPEPFQVKVSGIVDNALGPGKSLILCEMTDPRVRVMGAVAGMSGSPLYIDGKFAGALSYQVVQFETVHFAGFTPAQDMQEVGDRVSDAPPSQYVADAGEPPFGSAQPEGGEPGFGYSPLEPVFTLSGLSPAVARLMRPFLRSAGLAAVSIGGSVETTAAHLAPPPTLQPGDAVSVALATGDVTLAGTGTVSRVEGDRIIAFGHPMLSLGNVDLPMCSAQIVTIIPSAMESIKVANTGPVIGTISQDRLSAVSGVVGRAPLMIDVDVTVDSDHPHRLHFRVARQEELTPVIIAAGVSQAITGSNDAGLNNGFRITDDVVFAPGESLASRSLYAGPQAFALGITDFVKDLSQHLANPYERTFPQRVSFTVEPLAANPEVTLDDFSLSRSSAEAGDTVDANIAWRDYQGEEHVETIPITVPVAWTGKSLEVVLAPGAVMDELTGRPRRIAAAQLRSFGAYLAAMREDRPTDGLCLAVVENAAVFTDQSESTPELPGSFARIAAAADQSRFQERPALVPLWEVHVLPGKLTDAVVRRSLVIDQ
ncbi:MAG: SpoIVB peptidase S55 domain-containing protein [Opitutaceae bacterium]